MHMQVVREHDKVNHYARTENIYVSEKLNQNVSKSEELLLK